MQRLRRALLAFVIVRLLMPHASLASSPRDDTGSPLYPPGAIAVVTRASGPIVKLSNRELSRIALGQQQTLDDGTPVRFADLAAGPLREQFYLRIAQRNPVQMRAYWSRIVFTGRGTPPPIARNGDKLREWLARVLVMLDLYVLKTKPLDPGQPILPASAPAPPEAR